MDIRSVDLNLLVVFDAMVEHRSVTQAAEALNLSQPAMSAAVARLRGIFDDPLFVRAGSEMRPTPRAVELAGPVRRVVDTVKTEILQRNAFDPANSDRTFTLVTPDIGEVNFVPRILSRLAREAPHTNIKTLAMPRHTTADSLESGAAELALGYFPDLQKAGFFQQKLFRNSHVCMVRTGHPLVGAKISLTQFLALSHAVVHPDGREHVFEQYLHKRGLKRRVLVEISHFMSLLPIIEASDLVATVPRDVAEFCIRHGKVRIVEPPMKAPVIDVYQFWHRRFHKDPAHIWLRSAVHALFREPV